MNTTDDMPRCLRKETRAEAFIGTTHALFQVREGVPADVAISEAETALMAAVGLLGGIIATSRDSADEAYAARHLVCAALAAYQSAGIEA